MYELVLGLLGFLVGGFSGYIISYLKQKGKTRALKEDIAALEEEKQKVAIKYAADLEVLKKDNTLELELRKHKYQEKREQFSKYFALLDKFHERSNSLFTAQFPPILQKFLEQYLAAGENSTDQNAAMVEMSGDMQRIFNELNQEQLALKLETNSIRLISSPEVDELLDLLESAVVRSNDLSREMISVMGSPAFLADQSVLTPLQEEANACGQSVKSLQNQIKKQMKSELNEI